MFNDKSILITGGTGSFGKQFIKTVLQNYQPARLIVYSRDEFKQFEMAQQFDHPAMRFFLGDVRDRERLTFAMSGVDYVVHAAALKQVPAAEYNPLEFIKTNIGGAENIIKAAIASEVRYVIALSTDKAVNPINLYGASKLAADKLFIAANNMVGQRRVRFSVVRYGNVVGSRGSVVQLFDKLLQEGTRELPVTDDRMTRFWITLQQGVDLVLNSFTRMHGGGIFFPKMPSMRIVDLVEAMNPGGGYYPIGIRPGEKLHEMMCHADDSHLVVEFDDHYLIKPTISFAHKVDYTKNALGEEGRSVSPGFEYVSGKTSRLLSIEELRELNEASIS